MLLDNRGREIETVQVEIDVVRVVTGKAMLVTLSESGREVWIPLSAIDVEDCEITDVGDSGTLAVAKWFAMKEGLAEEGD